MPIALVAETALLLPVILPVLPESVMARSPAGHLRNDFADTVGWHDLVAEVDGVYMGLTPTDRTTAVIITDNYGEAGAINFCGRADGLPLALSGQLTFFYWKPTHLHDGPVIAVGLDPGFLTSPFATCTIEARITNSYGLHDEEFSKPISVCREPRLPLDQRWPDFKVFH